MQSDYQDKELTCIDCGKPFVFTASEQDFFTKKGFSNPKRCPDCRKLKKMQRNRNENPNR